MLDFLIYHLVASCSTICKLDVPGTYILKPYFTSQKHPFTSNGTFSPVNLERNTS